MELPTYTCRKISEPITIDGIPNERAWEQAEPARLVNYDGSRPAAQETITKLCWDDQKLYVAFWCADTDIRATMTKRDEPVWHEEVAEIFVNPSSDLVNYYEIQVSPRNVIFDLRITNPHHARAGLIIDPAWDCPGIETAVHIDGVPNDHSVTDRGWTVEIAIPFTSMLGAPSIPPNDGDTWRFNIFRIDRFPAEEFNCWSACPAPEADFHKPARFGTLLFRG